MRKFKLQYTYGGSISNQYILADTYTQAIDFACNDLSIDREIILGCEFIESVDSNEFVIRVPYLGKTTGDLNDE